MKSYLRIPAACLAFLVSAVLATTALFIGGHYYAAPRLPNAQQLRDVRMQMPLSVYSRDGRLMEQFGEVMRTPAAYRTIPELLINAVVAAEDERFFEHSGLDYRGVTRAVLHVLRTLGDRSIGGSTITQQVAKQYFLTPERLYVRKFKEWILALRIEGEFTKEEILELYLNTTFFGQGSYGVVTAARTYFGKELDDLTIAEAALIVGIAQGPSIQNPIRSPERAEARRAYVLRRMHELQMITREQYAQALAEPVESRHYGRRRVEVAAPYVAEMVRADMVRRFGPAALTAGYKVTTTVDSRLQRAANEAIRQGLTAYDERHGYRGPMAQVELPRFESGAAADSQEALTALLSDYPNRVGTEAALVLHVDEAEAEILFRARGKHRIGLDAVAWAAPYIDDERVGPRPRAVSDVLAAGDIVRFRLTDEGELRLAQLPDVQGALVALDPSDGGVAALVGGFDFFLSAYNRAVQSRRQPGSAFKPFVYSAALEHGFTPATVVNDAPLSLGSTELEAVWKPSNYSGQFYGDTRLREALVRSQNLASVRVVRDAGLGNTIRHLRGFGFDQVALPPDLTVSLGAGGISPLDLAKGFAVFANGGFLVEPYVIERIEDAAGNVLYTASPATACAACGDEDRELPEATDQLIDDVAELYPGPRRAPRVISPQNAYLITDMMQDVIRRGTGQRARQLGRGDLAGKTGTSNDHVDAWFGGYNADIVATAWVGFDQQTRSLGRAAGAREEGGRTALPMWNIFMAEALAGRPERPLERPDGIVEHRINPSSGKIASNRNTSTMFEKFYIDRVPEREMDTLYPSYSMPSRPGEEPPRAPDSPF